eukprot:SAG22_NODE_1829_length_3484_cov_2.530576_2_plen_321_part_00
MVPTWDIPPELAEIHAKVSERTSPGHILTGPIFVDGAEPGDVLKIDILAVNLRSNWAWTAHRPYGGGLSEPGPPHLRHTVLQPGAAGKGVQQPGTGWAFPPWGGRLPLAPFFGVLGVAPLPEYGRQSSIPPREGHGGNLDLKELTAGTTLWLPVNVAGALLFVGDGHARQGDGECCGTALETSLAGTFKLSVVKAAGKGRVANLLEAGIKVRAPLARPRAETASAIMTLAVNNRASLDEAAATAIEEMLDWLAELKPGLSRADAYCLLSVAADVRVTQIVNVPTKGAHCVLEKTFLEGLGETSGPPPVPAPLVCQACQKL